MKSSAVFLVLLWAALAQLPFGPLSPAKPKEDASPVKGWKVETYFAIPPNRYSLEGKGIIRAESLGSRSSLFKKVEKAAEAPILAWGWKISSVVRSAIEERKDRFDAAARVIVIFGSRGALRLREPWNQYGHKIEYIWATRLPRGHLFDHPGEENCEIFVLESGEGKVGQWVYERRNIRKDFETAFKTEAEAILAIGIETDTDQSNEKVTAYYSEPLLKKE